jgi:hypothetical protein
LGNTNVDKIEGNFKDMLKENKSKYELLEDEMNSNFDDFGSKLDKYPRHVINRIVTKQ